MNKILFPLLTFVLFFLTATQSGLAQQDFPYDKSIWPTDLKIQGNVIVCGIGHVPAPVQDRFLDLAGGEDAVILAIQLADVPKQSPLEKEFESASLFDEITLQSDQTSLPESFTKLIEAASGVWISGDSVSDAQLDLLRKMESDLRQLVDDGGVVLLAGDAGKMAGKHFADIQPDGVAICDGLCLVPDGVVSTSNQPAANLAALSIDPTLVSICVPNETSFILTGRKIRTIGEGEVEFRLMANQRKPFRVLSVPQSKTRRVNPYRELVDLTAWRRDAIDRTLPAFPVAKPSTPFVENGSLIIVGGGGMPKGLFDQFVELAGGKDAKLVYIPCTESESVSESRLVESWKGKVKSAVQFHTKDREKADSDEEFLKPLTEATGIWFGGGRQWNFVDSYYGTRAHQLMLQVLDRGGVIGGSSAGASIQGEYLARANPVANFDIMAPGYERGLGFLQGVAIDQHFSQRKRQANMTELANTYPQLLGIGIDEATAIIVQKSVAKVVGRGNVFFYDRNQPVIPGQDDFTALGKGEKFDLDRREVIQSTKEVEK